jgi:hypothetical protein
MKWAFAIQRKIRLAITLAILMLFIIIFSLIESYNTARISRSFNSIYEDRLIPAVDLYFMADHIHKKRHQLSIFIFTENIKPDEIKLFLEKENNDVDKLISKYENTHLVKTEANHLARLKRNLIEYRRDELMLIATAEHNKETAKKLYLNTMQNLYNELNKDLMELTQVQTQVGKKLLAESVNSKSSSTLISNLQLIITIILGFIIIILVMTNKQIVVKQDKYNLN